MRPSLQQVAQHVLRAALATPVLAGLAPIAGCSSSSIGGSGCNSAIPAYGAATQSCIDCEQTACGSQVSSFTSGCADYLKCVCSAQADPADAQTAALAACAQSPFMEASCQSSANALKQCAQGSCAGPCLITPDAGGAG